MKVWIIAKIRRNDCYNVYGFTEDNQNVRLLIDKNDSKQPAFSVGEIWDLSLKYPRIFLPHVENRIVDGYKFIGRETDIKKFLLDKVNPCKGGLDQIFKAPLKIGGNSGTESGLFVEKGTNVPHKSIAFWLPEKPLKYSLNRETFPAYNYCGYMIDYPEFDDAIPQIPAKTLILVSLKDWWGQTRSYLEICSWYL